MKENIRLHISKYFYNSTNYYLSYRRSYGNKPVLARVIRTGLQTNRGALVAAILYPPPADFKFDQDSYKFIGILACVAICGFIYTVVTKVKKNPMAMNLLLAISTIRLFRIFTKYYILRPQEELQRVILQLKL